MGTVGEGNTPGEEGKPSDPTMTPTDPPETPPPPPGAQPETLTHGPMRRLTRVQYANTVRDLLGVEAAEMAAGFGIDELDGGFAANAKAPLKELQIEKYLEGADALATKAVANLGQLAPCAAQKPAPASCLGDFLRSFGKRAYRRPLTSAEIARYEQLFEVSKVGDDFASGITGVIATMLQSPYFLYRPELGEGDGSAKEVPLTAYETASRLSYFLQNTMPDEELFAAADAGKLRTTEEITTQARRLLASPRARDTVVSFFTQWLEVEDILGVEKDPTVYPAFTPELRAAMKDEVIEYVDHVFRKADGKLETLLTAPYSFLRGPLYGLYGVPAKPGNAQLTNLTGGQRAGVFTLASVMARHAHPDQSSPVARGYVMSDKLLCVVPPEAPPEVDELPKPDPNVTTRQRFSMHREKPQCASCHQLMDPLGLAFEHYDGIGKWRTMDGRQMVDASSELTGTDVDGPVKDATELVGKLSRARKVQECMSRQFFRYAFGRLDVPSDAATIALANDAFGKSGNKLPDLMVAVTTTKAFRFRAKVEQ